MTSLYENWDSLDSAMGSSGGMGKESVLAFLKDELLNLELPLL